MHILITGGTGFIGTALVEKLISENIKITIVTTGAKPFEKVDYVSMPVGECFDVALLSSVDAIINLAGKNISSSRWSKKVKTDILESRINITRKIVASLKNNYTLGVSYPKVLINASAVGYYGTHPSNTFNESSLPGKDFLSKVAMQWEKEASIAKELQVRVVLLRFGIVLGTNGGILESLMKPFKFGLGGIVGSGKQWVSWVHMEDLLRIISISLKDNNIEGAFNICSPNTVTMKDLVKTLAQINKKKAWTRMPSFFARFVFGEMADVMLLNGQKVYPQLLIEKGYKFKFETIYSALKDIYEK